MGDNTYAEEPCPKCGRLNLSFFEITPLDHPKIADFVCDGLEGCGEKYTEKFVLDSKGLIQYFEGVE